MNKYLNRVVSLFLLPALLVDPSLASCSLVMAAPLTSESRTVPLFFCEQAMANRAEVSPLHDMVSNKLSAGLRQLLWFAGSAVVLGKLAENGRPSRRGFSKAAVAGTIRAALPAAAQPTSLLKHIRLSALLQERLLGVLDSISKLSEDTRVQKLDSIDDPAILQEQGLTAAEAGQIAPYVTQLRTDLRGWIASISLGGLSPEQMIEALRRQIRMDQLLQHMENTPRAQNRATLLVDEGLRQLMIEDQQALAKIVLGYTVAGPPGSSTFRLLRGIDWERWHKESPHLFLEPALLAAAQEFPALRNALRASLQEQGIGINPRETTSAVSLQRLRGTIVRMSGALLDLGYALQFELAPVGNNIFSARADFYHLDMNRAEQYAPRGRRRRRRHSRRVDRRQGPDKRRRRLRHSGKNLSVIVESKISFEAQNSITMRHARVNNRIPVVERTGEIIDGSILREIVMEDHGEKTDEELVDLERRILKLHEVSHAWERQPTKHYTPKDIHGKEITAGADFEMSETEWAALDPEIQTNTVNELGAFMDELIYGPAVYWQLAVMGLLLSTGNLPTFRALSRLLKHLAFRMSALGKFNAEEKSFFFVHGDTK